MTKFLAFDLGASGGRGIIGTLDNNKISLSEINRFYNGMTQIHGRYHWDIYRLYEEIKDGIKKAAAQNEIPVSIGIDTWGVDYGLLDQAGHIIDLPYAYRDHRTDNAMEQAFKKISKEKLYELTGIQFLQFNTVFQLFAAVRDNLPAMKGAKDMLFIPDLLNYLLSGVKKSEFSFATTSQLYNPVKKGWDKSIFDAIGVSVDIMQDIVKPGTVLGKLTEEIARETGMQQIDVTAVAAHDTGSAIAAIPAEDENFAYISSGTWSLMGIESKVPVISPQSLEYNFTNEGGVENTFRVLKNIMGLWLIQECKRSWTNAGHDHSYPELVEMARDASPFKTLIDPDHPGLLNPRYMPEAIAELAKKAGEPAMEAPGEFSRCIFESLAFRYRQTIESLRRISDKKIEKIHIIGGGSQNELLCQFAANATGLPLVAGSAEGTALGNIMVQAMAHGSINSLAEIRKVIRNSFDFKEFLPQNTNEWNKNYSRFIEVSEKLAK